MHIIRKDLEEVKLKSSTIKKLENINSNQFENQEFQIHKLGKIQPLKK